MNILEEHTNLQKTIIGLRNSAWANRHENSLSYNLIYKLMSGLLNDDSELLSIMVQFDIVQVNSIE